MASIKSSRKSTKSSSLFRTAIILFSLIVVILSFFAVPAKAEPHKEPENIANKLICHTNKAEECYYKIFRATEEFQEVREDQDLPTGLHVRMNIYTGQKEAKLYNPDEDIDPTLEGLPVDSDVIVVEGERSDEVPIPKGAPKYEDIGKIKQPQHGAIFVFETLEELRASTFPQEAWFDVALEKLEDISHDIYYGLKIAEDYKAVRGLLCLMSDRNAPAVNGTTPRDQQAALILWGALQNNPSALKEISGQWHSIMKDATCSHDQQPLDVSFWRSIEPSGVLPTKVDATKIKAKVSTISNLIKDESLRQIFFSKRGFKLLLEVFISEGQDWAGAHRKVAQLILDNFLDQDMGAILGQWPRVEKLSDKECKNSESTLKEGCWDYHVEKAMKANKGSRNHWSKELYDKLKVARKGQKYIMTHDDL